MGTLHIGAPQSFMQRYETMKKNSQVHIQSQEAGPMSPPHELYSPKKEEPARYELSNSRMSNPGVD